MLGITAYGAYLPRLRLQRKAAASANAWFAPGLGSARGERTMANWDEDSVTMAVEALRDALPAPEQRDGIGTLVAASTTFPFADRQNAGIVAAALALPEAIAAMDVTGSLRAGTSALVAALQSAAFTGAPAIAVASDRRKARAASSQELAYGDGAAGVVVGHDGVVARFVGSHAVAVDFVDHFRGEGEDFDYAWEERWVRDEGYGRIVPKAVAAALKRHAIDPAAVAAFLLPAPFAKIEQQVAKACGIDPARAVAPPSDTVGDCGAAQALLMLVSALEKVGPGDILVVAAFGQGVDVVIFEVTPAITGYRPARGFAGALKDRKEESNYQKFLAFNGLVPLEKGMRAEKDTKTALTVTYRKRDMLFSLKGGKCSVCGTAQFPRSRICVNPNCRAVDTQEPYSFAEKKGSVLSWSADYLTFAMDPPQHYGMITFAEGGRFIADFTDVAPGDVETGMDVRMVFRVKDFDERRGFRRYFWKAVPVREPVG